MRIQATLLALAVAALAGCIGDDEPATATDDAALTPETAEAEATRLKEFLADHPTFCDDEASCDFWDDDYHQYVVYDLDTTVIDVVVLPPVGGDGTDQLEASRLAAQAWSDGIEALGESWFVDNFTMNVYAVGVDVPSLDAVTDPEIIVISTSTVGLAGIGLEPKQIGCMLLGEDTLEVLPTHTHQAIGGVGTVMASDCTGIGFTCFAINAGAIDTRGLYDLIAHEIGHCLGAGHVGDALDFRAQYAPVADIMSYQNDPAKVHCVSNMDVLNLQGVYAHLLDRPAEEFLPRGSYMPFYPLDYMQYECENPPGM
ncbi:MAG: reprolysin-like metallopeptidase [Thermoplasmatota archaeon]